MDDLIAIPRAGHLELWHCSLRNFAVFDPNNGSIQAHMGGAIQAYPEALWSRTATPPLGWAGLSRNSHVNSACPQKFVRTRSLSSTESEVRNVQFHQHQHGVLFLIGCVNLAQAAAGRHPIRKLQHRRRSAFLIDSKSTRHTYSSS
jgi:hypothetical protein